MNNNFEFNKIESNNAEQLKPKSYYSANYIGQTQNKANIQQPSKESENKVEIKEKEVKTTQTKAAANSKLLTTFIAAISSVVIGATSIGGILPETVPTTLTATFQETYATEHEIFYCVEIGDSRNRTPKEEEFFSADGRVEEYYEDDKYYEIDLTDLYVVLHNEFTDRREKIEEQFWSGCFENLQEHMTYKLEVRYKDYVLASETMRTELEPEEEDVDPEEPYTEPITGDDIGGDPYTEPIVVDGDIGGDPYTEPIVVDGDGGDYNPSNPSNYGPDDPNNPDGTDKPTNNTDGNNTGGQTGNDDPGTAIVGAG